jgi:hypothetical protein
MSNPFIFGGPVAPNDFYGRSDSIEFIMDRLYGRSRSSVALWGDRRVGKSSLLHFLAQPKLRHRWVDSPGNSHMIFIDCQIFTEFDRQIFWQEVLDQVSAIGTDSSLPEEADRLLSGDGIQERALRRMFRNMQRSGETLTLLLDEFGHLVWLALGEAREEVRALLAFLRTTITAVNPASPNPRPLALVTSTRRPLDEVCRPAYGASDAGSPFHNPFVFERLKPFQIEDVYALVSSRLAGTEISFSEEEMAHLLSIAGCHPILVQSYASELFTAKEDLGEGVIEFAEIDQRFSGRNRQHFYDFWTYSGKAEKELLAELAGDAVQPDMTARGRERARKQLNERGLLDEELELFSPAFRDWLKLNLSRLLEERGGELGQQGSVQLFRLIDSHFNDSEVRDLCFELDVDYDNLSGDNKRDKARELVIWMRRYGRLEELTELLMSKRPHLHI